MNILAKIQRLPRDIQIYVLGWGLVAFGYFGIFGVLFNLYLLRLGYGTETIGLLVGAGQLVWGLAAIPAAMVGERVGNRQAMIWGVGGFTFATVLLLVGQWLPEPLRTSWIAVWWISSWVGSALMIVNGTPYVMANCPVELRRDAFTIQQATFGLCGFVGSLAAGALPGLFSSWSGLETDTAIVYWFTLWLAPAAYLGATLVIMQTRTVAQVVRKDESSGDAKMPLFIILFVGVIVFLQTSGEGTIRAFFNVYLDTALETPITQIGLVMGIGQFLPILSSLASPWLMDRWGTGNTIIITGIANALFMLLLVVFSNWAVASTGYIGVLLTISIAAIARNLFSQEVVDSQWRTLMSAVFTIGLAFGWASAAGAGGFIIARFGYGTLFLLGALMAAISSLLVWGYLRMGKRVRAAAPDAISTAP